MSWPTCGWRSTRTTASASARRQRTGTQASAQKTLSELQTWSARLARPLYEVAKLAADGEEEIDERTERIQPLVPLATRPRALIGQFVAIIEAARERLATGTMGEVLDLVLERTEFKDSLADGTEEGNERWQNVVELRNKLGEYDGLAGTEALNRFLEEVALVQDVDSLEEAESDAITLITLHAVKGLEYPYVFIVGVEDGICPHVRSIESRPQLEEERRLLYVGATRAMRALFLVHTFRRTMWGSESIQSPSRFLADIPPHLLDLSYSQAAGGGSRARSGGWGQREPERRVASAYSRGLSTSATAARPVRRPRRRLGRPGS